jgi:chromosome segregation ATPase
MTNFRMCSGCSLKLDISEFIDKKTTCSICRILKKDISIELRRMRDVSITNERLTVDSMRMSDAVVRQDKEIKQLTVEKEAFKICEGVLMKCNADLREETSKANVNVRRLLNSNIDLRAEIEQHESYIEILRREGDECDEIYSKLTHKEAHAREEAGRLTVLCERQRSKISELTAELAKRPSKKMEKRRRARENKQGPPSYDVTPPAYSAI